MTTTCKNCGESLWVHRELDFSGESENECEEFENMSEEKIELLDCPFCGGSASLEKREHSDWPIRVSCDGCKNGTAWFIDYAVQNAVKAWNTRTTADLREKLRVAEEALRHYADMNNWKNGDLTILDKDFIANEYDWERSGFVVAVKALAAIA